MEIRFHYWSLDYAISYSMIKIYLKNNVVLKKVSPKSALIKSQIGTK